MYNKYDLNQDGVMSEKEMELENRDRKEDQQRRMAWVAMISMIIFTGLLFFANISEQRVETLSEVITTFYIAQAGVVATFFGASAWVSKK